MDSSRAVAFLDVGEACPSRPQGLVGSADAVDQRASKKRVSNVIVMIGGRVGCSKFEAWLD